jgi:MFS transporter, SP family, major inositol transporter
VKDSAVNDSAVKDKGVAMATHGASRTESKLPPLVPGPYRKRVGLISIVATFGGLLFGYDTGVINGALNPMAKELGLTPLTEGVVTSSLVFAAAVGAFLGGRISDAIGRRTTIIILSLLFFTGSAFVVFTPNYGSPDMSVDQEVCGMGG